jgi:hypothetical protein
MTGNRQENATIDEKPFFLYYTPSGRIEKAVLFHSQTQDEGDIHDQKP